MTPQEYRDQYVKPHRLGEYAFSHKQLPAVCEWARDNMVSWGANERDDMVERVFGPGRAGFTFLLLTKDNQLEYTVAKDTVQQVDEHVRGWFCSRYDCDEVMLHPSVLKSIPPKDIEF
jgi:hypothetical protein